MTLSLPRFRNSAALGVALLYTTVTFGATLTPTPAAAQGSNAFYTAELTAPAKEARVIGGGVVWRCEGTTCVAGKGTSAPVTMCRKLVREVGAVASFTAKGEALAAEKLAQCNG